MLRSQAITIIEAKMNIEIQEIITKGDILVVIRIIGAMAIMRKNEIFMKKVLKIDI
jgi:hypothetical protein